MKPAKVEIIEIPIEERFRRHPREFVAKVEKLRNGNYTNPCRRKCHRPGAFALYYKRRCLVVGFATSNVGMSVVQTLNKKGVFVGMPGEVVAKKTGYLDIYFCDSVDAPILGAYLTKKLQPVMNLKNTGRNHHTSEEVAFIREVFPGHEEGCRGPSGVPGARRWCVVEDDAEDRL